MLYYLLYPLREYFSAFNVFKYISFRAIYATVTALIICFILGPYLIEKLRKLKIGQNIRDDGPQTHLTKSGTPTMGGILIIIATIIPVLLWSELNNRYVLISIFAMLWLGGVGFIDDYLKITRKGYRGLRGKYKIIAEVVFGLAVGSILYFFPADPNIKSFTNLPFFKNYPIDFFWFYIPFVTIVIVGTSNAVNLTDGLDGLAVGLTTLAFLAYAVMSYLVGNAKFSDYLDIFYIRGSGELTIVCAAVIGAGMGFLWYNASPASVFMGDTGSLALGGVLGTVAVLIKHEFLLLLVGGVFVAEAVSVILQVFFYKTRGKRIFKMAPIHHHFELMGWKETKVVIRFWIIGIMLLLLSLSTLKLR